MHGNGRRPRTRRVCGLALTLAAMLYAHSRTGGAVTVDPDWTVTIDHNGSTSLYGEMVAVDDIGYVYVAGSYPWSTIITAKFDQLGNRIWQRDFDNPGTREQGSWVASHPAGGVVVAGYTVCCDYSDSSTTGYVTVRYDADGNVLWSDVVPALRGRTVRVEVDANGNAYVIARAWVGNSSGGSTDRDSATACDPAYASWQARDRLQAARRGTRATWRDQRVYGRRTQRHAPCVIWHTRPERLRGPDGPG